MRRRRMPGRSPRRPSSVCRSKARPGSLAQADVPLSHPIHNHDDYEDRWRHSRSRQSRDEWKAGLRLDVRSGEWRRWIEVQRFRHVVPPEDLEIDGEPAPNPDDSTDPLQSSHNQNPRISTLTPGTIAPFISGATYPIRHPRADAWPAADPTPTSGNRDRIHDRIDLHVTV